MSDENGMSSILQSRETYINHVRKQLTEHFILEVKGQALCRQLSFLENRKTLTYCTSHITGRSSTVAFDAHGVVGGLNAAKGGAFLYHEAEQTCEDGGDGPGRVPRVWMEVCDGQTQPVEAKT